MKIQRILCASIALVAVLVSGCGGGGTSTSSSPNVPPRGIGAAGGTVSGPGGAQVVVPAGALTQDTAIAIAQSSAGAPALPAGVTAAGSMFAFTPHGTSFAVPAAVTVPFDPAQVPAGSVAALYKTNAAQTGWEAVAGATVSGSTMSGQVGSFSYLVVVAPPPTVELEWMRRAWKFTSQEYTALPQTLGDTGRMLGSGVVDDLRIVGGLAVRPQGQPDGARLHVFSSDDGGTYWVSAQVPAARFDDPFRIEEMSSELRQQQYFIKQHENATLRLKITRALLELIDANPDGVPSQDCVDPFCPAPLRSVVSLYVRAYNYDTGIDLLASGGVLYLDGFQGHWNSVVVATSLLGLWRDEDERFEIDRDVEPGTAGAHARIRLLEPIVVTVPLSGVAVGEMFMVDTQAQAHARDERHRTTYAGAFVRDPQSSDAVTIEHTGLIRAAVPAADAPPYVEPPASECNGEPDPAAGTLQFTTANFDVSERSGPGAWVFVTRRGGSQGAVSALLETDDDTVSTHVGFADGQSGRRLVEIPITDDLIEEDDRAIQLQLSDVRGCASLGAVSNAVLTIRDDDAPPPPPDPSYSVSFSVSGLTGSGLIVEDAITSETIAPTADGRYTFDFPYFSGLGYNVRVRTQPSGPLQACAVRNGSGTIADANVSDVVVQCVTPASPGSLDQTFGMAGKVVVDDLEGADAIVIQSTGRVVVLTERFGAAVLARFMSDGSADPTFGSAGRVNVIFNGGAGEEAHGLSMQADDKLVVVGRARTGTRYDMAVARYNTDGSVDTTFGNNGVATIDPSPPAQGVTPANHVANKALIGSDGRIYVAGLAGWVQGLVHGDFAVARLNSDGTPDASFAAGRGAIAALTNEPDIAFGIGVQSDGKVVLSGTVNNSQGLGLARFKANGLLDTDDPRTPANYGLDDSGMVLIETTPAGALRGQGDLVMLPDDSVVLLGSVPVPHTTLGFVQKVCLARVSADGVVGTSDAFVTTSIGPANDVPRQLIRQPDGKLLLAAQISSDTTVSDMGVIRYNADLTLDASFADNGVLLVDFFGAREIATALAVQGDGKVLAAGSTRNGTRDVLALVRINP